LTAAVVFTAHHLCRRVFLLLAKLIGRYHIGHRRRANQGEGRSCRDILWRPSQP
jgi:hypothetical protein